VSPLEAWCTLVMCPRMAIRLPSRLSLALSANFPGMGRVLAVTRIIQEAVQRTTEHTWGRHVEGLFDAIEGCPLVARSNQNRVSGLELTIASD
jgi:hypothetical protein